MLLERRNVDSGTGSEMMAPKREMLVIQREESRGSSVSAAGGQYLAAHSARRSAPEQRRRRAGHDSPRHQLRTCREYFEHEFLLPRVVVRAEGLEHVCEDLVEDAA